MGVLGRNGSFPLRGPSPDRLRLPRRAAFRLVFNVLRVGPGRERPERHDALLRRDLRTFLDSRSTD